MELTHPGEFSADFHVFLDDAGLREQLLSVRGVAHAETAAKVH